MHAVKEYFGEQLDWYGRGINELRDGKLAGLSAYKYHIVLENGCWPHYWTEKLADAFVANCFPFYWGAPNIFEYFESGSLLKISLDDPKASIRTIEKAIEQGLYEKSQISLSAARNKILTEYHPYEVFTQTLNNLPESEPGLITVKPHNLFRYDLSTRWRLRIEKYLRKY